MGGLLILTIDLLTEQGPAISLAYEPAEALVMERPPRDIKNDRLINGPLLRYAYLTYGIMTVCQPRCAGPICSHSAVWQCMTAWGVALSALRQGLCTCLFVAQLH